VGHFRAFCPPRLHYFGNEGGWIKNTYAAIKEFISKPAVEPIAAAVRSPEKRSHPQKAHRLKRLEEGREQGPLQNLLLGLQLNQRNGMPSPQAKIKLNARERETVRPRRGRQKQAAPVENRQEPPGGAPHEGIRPEPRGRDASPGHELGQDRERTGRQCRDSPAGGKESAGDRIKEFIALYAT
jgi:hypothetical protein